jgi:hypothetical protein
MMSIADRGLRHLRSQGLRVEQQQMLQRRTLLEFILDHLGWDPICMPLALDDRLVWCGVPTKEHRNADRAFESCHGDLRRRTIRHDVDKRDDAGGGEIQEWQFAARCVDDLPECHRNEFKIREQSLVDGLR